jgi:primosomal protein N' (replication factor Y)
MTPTPPAFVDVVFPESVQAALTYGVPEPWRSLAVPGKRVRVPLGPRKVTGYLVGSREAPAVAGTKEIEAILDDEPLLDTHLLDLTRWAADYYLSSWGEVIRTALPPGIDSLSRRVARLTEAGRLTLEGHAILRPGEREILQSLAARAAVPLGSLARRAPQAEVLLRGLAQRGLISVAAEVRPPRVRPQTVPVYRIAPGVEVEAVPLPARAERQRAVLRAVAAAPRGLTRAEAGAGSPAALAALVKKGLLLMEEVEMTRDPFAGPLAPADLPKTLAPAQAAALQAIREAIDTHRFQPLLLYGVTGSGKTEVYLQAIQSVLDQGGQALVLVPEIALTPLSVQRFRARFGGRVAALHSGLTGGERFDAWRRIKGGGADIVIGARSAVFAPLPRLGMVVVDEEHDPSYKQDDSPCYHGRDVAVMRAKQLGIPVLLGSATPSLESYERAAAGRYRLLTLSERIEARPLPQVEIVDLRRVEGGERLLSPPLCDAIAACLARQEQCLLFLNRRGFSSLLLCEECGATIGCPHCSLTLTYHAARGRLRCHTCDFERRPPDQCPGCRGARMRYLGFGTQQLEAAVTARFPQARVARMDRDTSGTWRAAERILDDLAQGRTDILVGTQMIGKGHDVPNVTLVGVVSADMALNLPDFRAGERAFALFTQVVGRAGRGDRPGMALIQTFNPDHYILRAVQAQDYAALWAAESPLRREQGLPPFGRAVLALLSSATEPAVEAAAVEFARLLREAGLRADGLCGPAPAPLYRVRSRYRWHLFIKGADLRKLHQRVWAAAKQLRASPVSRGVRLDLDIDPASVC